MQPVVPSTTDVDVTIRIVDSTTFLPETAVTSASAGIDLWYRKGATGAKTSLTEADYSALTDAHGDGKLLHIGDGYYRLGLPDAAVPTAENEVTVIGGTVTGMVVLGTALVGKVTPNATAPLDAAGVRAAVGLGSANLDTQLTAIDDYLDTEVAAIKAKTDHLPADPADASDIAALIDALPTAAEIWAAITSAAANVIADHVPRRTTANVEASANGDSLGGRSLYGAVSRLVHKRSISGSTLTVTKSDDSTTLTTEALTTDSAADPVTGSDPAA